MGGSFKIRYGANVRSTIGYGANVRISCTVFCIEGTAVENGIPCGADSGLGSSWESNLRMPTLVRWPGRVTPGTVSSELASTMDIFMTVLAIAGVPIPTSAAASKGGPAAADGRLYDGKDITAVLKGEGKSPHEFLYFWRQFYVEKSPAAAAAAARDTPSVVQLPRPELAAVRHGVYKAHFATASAMGMDTRVLHDPPLMFQVEVSAYKYYPTGIVLVHSQEHALRGLRCSFFVLPR